ncbi:MAG TPA: ATP-binding cassette domain-containing protein, partial [Gammaproteobacteria bacterium]|nr:ATP-binding cassette domain-containing protein [Gammaproteobacteria bacterium]
MIRLREIGRDFLLGNQTVHALADINLDIEQGDYVSIMGPSGSGKSTLLNIIALLDRPTRGDYRLNDHDVTGLPDEELAKIRRENIGFVFQFFHLIPRLTATENIEIPLILAGMAPQERKTRVSAALKNFGLEQRSDHRP